ncbi:MCM-domain-containing protein, partial [Atractiella rhizophila]
IPFSQNVELTEPILSRFDVLCVVRDTVDPAADERLAQFVVGSHTRSHPEFEAEDEAGVATMEDAEIIPHDLLKKYIQYARERVQPKLGQIDREKLSKLYAELRRESLQTGSYPITVRHLESTMRLAEASAKMALREYVRSDDVNLAIQVEVGSFVNAQKTSIRKSLERGFRKYIQRSQDQEELLAFILGQLVKEKYRYHQIKNRQDPTSVVVKITELEDRVKELDIFDVRPFLNSKVFKNNGYKKTNDTIVKEFEVVNEEDEEMEE